jgi:hypothetical protein
LDAETLQSISHWARMEVASTSLSPGETAKVWATKVSATGPSSSGVSCLPREEIAAVSSALGGWALANDSIPNIGFEDFHTFTDTVNWMPTPASPDFAAALQATKHTLPRASLQQEEQNLPRVGPGSVASPCLELSPLNISSNSSTTTSGAMLIRRVEKLHACRANGCSASFVERRQLE